MIDRLVVLGATGDLTGRYLLPGLAALRARGYLSDGFELVGAGLEHWDDEQFRGWAAGWLQRRGVDAGAATTLVRSSRYARLDLVDPASVAACLAGEGPVAVYLALPPAVFPSAVSALAERGFRPTARWLSRNPSERTSRARRR
jgi:glucose-6-phosphate 1-dehydrogenase